MFDIYKYINEMEDFEGWCNPLTARIIYKLGIFQTQIGNVLEIGVHHGKSFIPLAASIKSKETAVALDVFEDQHLNYDGSGNGNKNIFNENILKWIDCSNQVLAIQKDSTAIDPTELYLNNIPYRMISIDGCHTRSATKIDMDTADILLDSNDGIIFVDDILNPHWLGVVSGYVDFIFNKPESFIPVAYIPNKLIMSRSNSYDKYKMFLRDNFGNHISKIDVPLFNNLIDIYE